MVQQSTVGLNAKYIPNETVTGNITTYEHRIHKILIIRLFFAYTINLLEIQRQS
jgi:hypothetical protein